jgi:hypothetical protein
MARSISGMNGLYHFKTQAGRSFGEAQASLLTLPVLFRLLWWHGALNGSLRSLWRSQDTWFTRPRWCSQGTVVRPPVWMQSTTAAVTGKPVST